MGPSSMSVTETKIIERARATQFMPDLFTFVLRHHIIRARRDVIAASYRLAIEIFAIGEDRYCSRFVV